MHHNCMARAMISTSETNLKHALMSIANRAIGAMAAPAITQVTLTDNRYAASGGFGPGWS